MVVPCRDRAELLADALAAIRSCLGPDDDLVVVDSASRTSAVGEVARAAGAHLVRCEQPGVSRARNAGAEAVDVDVVVFTDDDCRPVAGWLDALVRPLAEDDTVHFVSGAVHAAGAGPALSVDERPAAARVGADTPVELLGHSANMAVRRELLVDVLGGFDEVMGSGAPLRAAEDADLQWRALRRGYEGWYEPAAVTNHESWRGRPAALRQLHAYGMGAGALALKIRCLESGRGHFSPAREVMGHLRRDLANGYRFGVLASLVRLVGVLRGAVAARWRPLDGEVYRAQR